MSFELVLANERVSSGEMVTTRAQSDHFREIMAVASIKSPKVSAAQKCSLSFLSYLQRYNRPMYLDLSADERRMRATNM